MATSLVSTGVQFPDSTIQTTAATASSPPGLVLVSTVNPTASTTVVLNFSSTYDNYIIKYEGIRPNTTQTLNARISIGGTLQTTSIYKTSESTNTISAGIAASRNYMVVQLGSQNGATSGLPAEFSMSGDIIFHGINTAFSKYACSDAMMHYSGGQGDGWYSGRCTCMVETTSALSSITFYWGSGTINFAAQGTFRLYGYKN